MPQNSTHYHTLLEDFLRNPRPDVLKDLIDQLEERLMDRPPCPECNSTHIHKLGTNSRKGEYTQQFRCVSCHHVYSWRSLESRLIHEEYSLCPTCQGNIRRAGFWKWTKKDGTVNHVQRYQCKKCKGFFRLKKNVGKSRPTINSGVRPTGSFPQGTRS